MVVSANGGVSSPYLLGDDSSVFERLGLKSISPYRLLLAVFVHRGKKSQPADFLPVSACRRETLIDAGPVSGGHGAQVIYLSIFNYLIHVNFVYNDNFCCPRVFE